MLSLAALRRHDRVAGRTVLVTGAARGIGAGVCERLHERGANVALVGLEAERLSALGERLGDRAMWFEADVTDREAIGAAVGAAVERFGGLDVAIANAGVHWTGGFAGTPLEQVEREIEINLLGVVRTADAVLPELRASRGYLLNVASLAAISHAPLLAGYSASKAGVEAFSDSIRQELRHEGVAVGCAYFSLIDTDMVRDAMAQPSTERAMGLAPSFMRRSAPLEVAVDAIERGVEGRSARVFAPRFVGPAMLVRGIAQPLIELRLGRSSIMREACRADDAGPADLSGARSPFAPPPPPSSGRVDA